MYKKLIVQYQSTKHENSAKAHAYLFITLRTTLY